MHPDKKTEKSITAAEFKAKCLQLMDFVNEQQTSLTITKRGIPVAKLVPYLNAKISSQTRFGCMIDTIHIHGDILKPLDEEWDALK